MTAFAAPDWAELFAPDRSLFDSFLRGTAVYFSVLAVFRLLPRRQVGSVGMADILLLVLVSEAVSNALNAQSLSLPNGVAALAALAFWNVALDRAAHRWPRLQRILEHKAVPLVRDGEPIRDSLAKEGITDEELLSQLRVQGVDDLKRVRAAFIEPSGQVSVLKSDDGAPTPGRNGVHRPPADEADGDGPPDLEGLVSAFVAAAKRLQEGAAWHERRAAEHAKAAKEARDLLTRHGVRGRAALAGADEQVSTESPETNVSGE